MFVYVSVFFTVCIHISYAAVSVCETFVKLTFIRHKIHHFAKVNRIHYLHKVGDANGNNIHHCSYAYIYSEHLVGRMELKELNHFS